MGKDGYKMHVFNRRLISDRAANDMSKLVEGKKNLKRLGTTHNLYGHQERKLYWECLQRGSARGILSRLSGRYESGFL